MGDTAIKATTGFIDRWKTRHGIGFKKVCREAEVVSPADTETWLDGWTSLYQNCWINSHQKINADDTGLFYKLQPEKSLAFNGQKCSGGKKAKDRLTILVGASMTGKKLALVIFEKSKLPQCFKGVLGITLPTPKHG